jgi:hypothetical protein
MSETTASFDPAAYLGRAYPSPPCWSLVADVYATARGQSVLAYRTVTSSIRAIAAEFRLQLHKSAHGFAQIAEPQDLCIVLLGKSRAVGVHHCGIWWQGHVLHALDSGVLLQDVASLSDQYEIMEFWARPEAADEVSA